MHQKSLAERLWGQRSNTMILWLAAIVMIFAMLGSREIWTQEHRWADIVYGMFFRHDFLHPYLDDVDYYDKPLLSYWLIAGLTYITGHLSTWTLRIPSALAAVLSVWSIYRIGEKLQDKRLGLLSGWLLVTTFYFLFWAKTSSADMLNLGGVLFAVAWYITHKDRPSFLNYTIFFLILAFTSLCKGLTGAVVPLIVIFPDLMMRDEWKKHLHPHFFLAMVPAAIVYIIPFWASSHFGGKNYGESGLYLVYRENILRYFQPFDHKGPIYTYFLWLPIYLMPWALFFIPALVALKSRWRNLTPNAKWMAWSVFLLFLFFTLSGSRRNYYVLSIVPFALIMTAEWILSGANILTQRYVWAGRVAVVFFAVLFLSFDVVQPLYYAEGGMQGFATALKTDVTAIKPWSDWQFVMLDPESKVRFYLQLPPTVKNYAVVGSERNIQTREALLQAWPILQTMPAQTIYISRKIYEPVLQTLLLGYHVVETPPSWGERLLGIQNINAPIAFVPNA